MCKVKLCLAHEELLKFVESVSSPQPLSRSEIEKRENIESDFRPVEDSIKLRRAIFRIGSKCIVYIVRQQYSQSGLIPDLEY